MTKAEIIKAVDRLNGADMPCIPFISSFNDGGDTEVASVITAWLYNSDTPPLISAGYILHDVMGGSPMRFILNYDNISDITDFPYGSLAQNISWWNFHNLINILKKTYLCGNGLRNMLDNYMQSARHKCKYVHDGFADIFGHNTFFPNRQNKGTFFRYNLLYYWLTRKLGVWDDTYSDKALLPCNDTILARARKHRIIRRQSNFTPALANVAMLTDKAREVFGKQDYYKMYELLNGLEDD